MIATLDHVEIVGKDIQTFWFKPEQQMRYDAGQFTELYLSHNNPDNRGERRWFTLSSAPNDPLLAITTRWSNDHPSTFKQVLFALPLKTKVTLADPMGDFVLPKDKSIPLIFVAGGMGITPMHSMIKQLADTRKVRDITLFYSVRDERQLLWRELFESYNMDFKSFIQNKPQIATTDISPRTISSPAQTKHMTTAHVKAVLVDKPNAIVYLSGPETLTKAFAVELESHGVSKHRIVTDFFPGYTHI